MNFEKHIKIRITNWCKRLCQITDNQCWKKNRNLHAIYLLNMIINNNFEDPYNKLPPSDYIPILSRPLVNSRLTDKFWQATKNIFETSLKGESNETDNKKNNKNNCKNNIKEGYINEKEEKRKYIEICKILKLKNEKCDEIIIKQEEENKILIKKIEELENALNKKINLNQI